MDDQPESAANERKRLLPDGWTALSPLVDAVLDVPAANREARIVVLTGGDADRAATLRAIVADCERGLPLLDAPAPETFVHLIADEPEQILPDLLGDRYRIERELGRGGMARVFLALDTKHNRHVAVKVIRSELAASLGRERFLREIAIAARLRHPNIVPLYDSGDANGVLYFVMPYEEGQSLGQRLGQKAPLPASEYLGVLRDVARALAYAHEHGVVHRDIKPDNVMLSGGAVVVADFGIAKAVSVAQGGSGSTTTLTQTGSGIGTPTYMAPEQAVGDPATDHRADIYSFGCLAYELISGQPPFHGLPAHQLIAAHVATTPVDIAERRADVPEAVARIVMQCLEKEPADRPQSADALLSALDESLARTQAAPPIAAPLTAPTGTAKRRTQLATGVGLPVALALAVIGYVAFRAPAAAPPADVTVAVLPLQSSGGDSVQRLLAEGLSDEVATELFRVSGVRVMSRRGVANYRNQREFDTEKLGRELGAQYLVTGTLREVDGRLRVLASLLRASDGVVLWTDRFDRTQNELSAVRDAIALAIGDTLRRIASPGGAQPLTRSPVQRTANPDAYRLYVLAQRALDRRGQSVEPSVALFRQATELDTLFANAYSGLSFALALSPNFGPVAATAVSADVIRAAERAIRLDPTLSQPHVALGVTYQYAYEWDRASAEFITAIRLDSRDAEARIQYGRHLMARGRLAEAIRQFAAAHDVEPASALVSSYVSYGYYVNGQLDSALAESARAFQNDSTNITTLAFGAMIRLRAGRNAEALDFARRVPLRNATVRYALAAIGDPRAFDQPSMVASGRPATLRAFAMLGKGDTAQALTALEDATDANENWPFFVSMSDPALAAIRTSARFDALLRRIGLAELVRSGAINAPEAH